MRKAFQPRPYDPDRQYNRTVKQKEATDRNFRIFRLRGLWVLAYILTEPTRSTVQALIDFELQRFGALPQREHAEEQRRKWLARNARLRQAPPDPIDDDDLPF